MIPTSHTIEPGVEVPPMNDRIVLGNDTESVEWKLEELLKENRNKVIFDLAHVTVLDSTGVGIMVMCYARLKEAGGALHQSALPTAWSTTLRA